MKINLSDGEWKLMNRLWEHSPMTITELTGALREETGWSKHTVITMLSRLEAKGAVYYEEGPRAKRYFAALAREDAARTETENFLELHRQMVEIIEKKDYSRVDEVVMDHYVYWKESK